jgi:predicted metalloprotease with PDZ domain
LSWFHEGFTEYAANRAMLAGGLIDEAAWRAKLAAHVDKYGKLATPLDAPGGHKGPPLYSGGALVAFCWDTKIREESGGQRDIGDFMRALWRRTDAGARPYTWSDIAAALAETAPGDWDDFERRFIHGTEPLPLAEAFSRAERGRSPS